MDKEYGYVYILTNPSFREDWIKIGKSCRPVNIRSKELDNTAVPLPFEIYATLKTKDFDKIESFIHKQIDLINPDMRIRKGREFFNVHPAKALEIFKMIAMMQPDAVIDIYENGKVVESSDKVVAKKENPAKAEKTAREVNPDVVDNRLFYIKDSKSKTNASMQVRDGKFVVLRGSTICNAKNIHLRSDLSKVRAKFIEEHITIENGSYILKEDVIFDYASFSAVMVRGRSSNGWLEWKDKNGQTLDQIFRRDKIE